MRLEWSELALKDRIQAFEFVARDSVQSAIAIDDAIEVQAEGLLDFPERGRPGRCAGTRELVINGFPFTAAYSIAGDTVRILRVLHQAQEWPGEISP